jgi:hypothetical protein
MDVVFMDASSSAQSTHAECNMSSDSLRKADERVLDVELDALKAINMPIV